MSRTIEAHDGGLAAREVPHCFMSRTSAHGNISPTDGHQVLGSIFDYIIDAPNMVILS